MPEQAIMPTAGAAPTTGAGAQPARAGFTMEDIPAFFKNRNLMGKPYDERSSMLETVINGAYQDAAQNGLSPKEHVAFGDFVQKARQKLADSETAGEKAMGATRFVGEALAGMGKDIGAVAYAGGNATSDIHHGRPDRALATAATVGNAATNKLVGYGADLEQWGKAHTAEGKALDSGINDVLSGIDKGEHLKDPVGWLKSQADKLTPLQEKYHAGGIDDPSQLTRANRLDTPENTALLTTYMATRNPMAKAQLKANLLRTGQRAAVAKDQQEILNSLGAQEFEKTFGKGSAQHLVNGSDPVTILSLAFPFLRGAGAMEAGASTLSKAASFAAQQTAFGVVSAIQENPSDPEYLKHIAEMTAVGGTMHVAGMAAKAALNRGMEPPPLPPEATPTEGGGAPPKPSGPVFVPASDGTFSSMMPSKAEAEAWVASNKDEISMSRIVESDGKVLLTIRPKGSESSSAPAAPTDTDAVAMEQFGNTGKAPADALDAHVQAALGVEDEPAPAPPEAAETPPVVESPPVESPAPESKGFTKTELPPGHGTEAGYVKLPTGALDHGIELIRQGITDFAKWSVAMVRKFGENIKAYLKDLFDAASKHPRFTALKEIINGWSGRIQVTKLHVQAIMKEIERMVPDVKRRTAITNWLQAGGDDAVLAAREAKSGDLYKQGYRDARNLTPDELAMAQRIRGFYSDALLKAQSHGLVEDGLANYVNQVWKLPWGQLARKFMFGNRRAHESFFEGEQAGLTPVTKDISKLLGIYLTEMGKTIATREMIGRLVTGEASTGAPLAFPEGLVIPNNPEAASRLMTMVLPGAKGKKVTFKDVDYSTEGYRAIDNPHLAKWKFVGLDTDGNPVTVLGKLALHPEAYKHIKNALGVSEITKAIREGSDNVAGKIGRDLLRFVDAAQSMIKQDMMSLSPFHVVQEGTHAIGHKVNPFTNIPAVDPSNPKHVDAMNHGLMLSGDRVSMREFMEGLGQNGGILQRIIPGLKQLNEKLSGFTFEHYIPGLKLKTYERILERNTRRFAKDIASGKLTLDDVKYNSAKQTNAAFGHQNYKDMGRNPTIQHLLRLTLLAPDFLEARAKFTGQAIQGLLGGKFGREQAVAMATLAVTFYVAARVMNAAFNKGDMKNDMDHLFGVQIGNRIWTMRSVPEDIFKLVRDPRRFIGGRISPIIGTGVMEGLYGLNYRGEKTSKTDALQDMLAHDIPISARMIPGINTLTRTQKNNPVSGWEQFLGAAGFQINRTSPITETQKMAHAFSAAMGEADRGTYPVSKYQQLRYALEDLNWDKAAAEIKGLLGTNGKHSDLRKNFHESLFADWTKNKAMDKQWKATLKPEQAELLEQAEQRRKDVWARFQKMMEP